MQTKSVNSIDYNTFIDIVNNTCKINVSCVLQMPNEREQDLGCFQLDVDHFW